MWDETIGIVQELCEDVWGGKDHVVENIVDVTIPVSDPPVRSDRDV